MKYIIWSFGLLVVVLAAATLAYRQGHGVGEADQVKTLIRMFVMRDLCESFFAHYPDSTWQNLGDDRLVPVPGNDRAVYYRSSETACPMARFDREGDNTIRVSMPNVVFAPPATLAGVRGDR